MAISYLTMLEKTDSTTRLPASEYNEIKDAITDGSKSITTQGLKLKSSSYSSSAAINVGGFNSMDSSSGTLTMTLAAPAEAGILCIISLTTAGNNATVTTASGVTINSTGNNTLTFDTAYDTITLISLSTTRWDVVSNNGVALSTV